MKRTSQSNPRWQSLLLASLAAIFLFSACDSTSASKEDAITVSEPKGADATAEPNGVGAKFGARDPHTCKDRTQPKGNVISAEKAKEYFLCSEYWDMEQLHLYDEVTVQVGTPRPYNDNDRGVNFLNGIDATIPVTPIRGSFKQYKCKQVDDDYMKNRGKNCTVFDYPNAFGICYRDGSGNWNCVMNDLDSQRVRTEAPPPGGARQAYVPADTTTGQNPQLQTNEQPRENTNNLAARGGNDYPTPDLSDMQQWYEIIQVQYGDAVTDPQIHFLFRPKVDHYSRSQARFEARYYDKDGVSVGSSQVWVDYPTEVGEVGKGSAGTPSEREMEKVGGVKFVRLAQ